METAEKIEEMQKMIDGLNDSLERMGKNSRGTTDIYGRPFSVPVDAEHKATKFILCTPGGAFGIYPNFDVPHNRAFWTSAFGFFASFFSMFAGAPLPPLGTASGGTAADTLSRPRTQRRPSCRT